MLEQGCNLYLFYKSIMTLVTSKGTTLQIELLEEAENEVLKFLLLFFLKCQDVYI